MKNKVAIAVVIMSGSLLLNSSVTKAQDVRFTQFYQNPLLMNPAIMGASPDMVAGLCYRNQWGSVSSGYSSYSFNGMYPFYFSEDKNKLDAGLSVMEDKAGAFTSLNAMVAVDYNREIADDQYLCLALLGGYGQEAISTGGLTYDDQYVHGSYSSGNLSNESIVSTKKGYADVGFGFTWYMNPSVEKSKVNAYLGVAGFHMNQPNISMTGAVSRLPIRMTYQGGVKILESDKINITPNAMLATQNGNTESAIGCYLDYIFSENFKMTLGVWYRRHDAIPILLGFEFKGFSLGYSYDAVTSSISNLSSGIMANEITLTYRLNRKKGGGSTASFISSSGGTSLGGKATPASGGDGNPSPFPKF